MERLTPSTTVEYVATDGIALGFLKPITTDATVTDAPVPDLPVVAVDEPPPTSEDPPSSTASSVAARRWCRRSRTSP